MRLTAPLCFAALVLPRLVLSATIRVPADQPTIQAGINAASTGDSILVAPGTYFENVVMDRRVTLVSEAGAEVTTIDGRSLGPVILVRNTFDHAVIDGFRVTHGWSDFYAGGIHVELFGSGGYASIKRNIIEHNYSGFRSGGLIALQNATIEDNVIQYNNEQISKGIAVMEVSGTIQRNVIRNTGIALHDAFVGGPSTFAWNVFVGWTADVHFSGGGSIHNNTFVRQIPIPGPSSTLGSPPATVYLSGSVPFEFTNNLIVHLNFGGLLCGGNGSYTIHCNDAWGEGPSYMEDCEGLQGIDGNFSADPLFCDVSNGDLTLNALSPCAPGNSPTGCGLIGALPVACGVTDVADSPPAVDLRLRVIPNPVRGVARFELGSVAPVATLSIFDSQGRLVEQLQRQDGHWNWTPGTAVPAGVYFAKANEMAGGMEPVKFLYLR